MIVARSLPHTSRVALGAGVRVSEVGNFGAALRAIDQYGAMRRRKDFQ
jgi:hypothetical protein